jgi:UDP-N-acetylglucosamine 2-epimerase (non-hydrolysing)/GDP/UDP-N,N'-diacetylbacillosamine 2-epimerase (hydrolysing)
MRRVLEAIRSHPKLQLQMIVTGMHLDASRGLTARAVCEDGWCVDAAVPWRRGDLASATGDAMAGIARALDRLQSDIVLVVGDRVEAFAAGAAGHLGGRIVAHVHGGDRALGTVDDSLRHAITKLAHIHFAATRDSANRIVKLGEGASRIHWVGAPGIDGIKEDAAALARLDLNLRPKKFALLVLHPADTGPRLEQRRAELVFGAVKRVGFEKIVIVYPNNDPGADGIVRCWRRIDAKSERFVVKRDLPRNAFLGLLKEAAVLVGNSSSGIIEAASFGTPVINIGPRQQGRLRSGNVLDVPYDGDRIFRELDCIWNRGRPLRWRGRNVYGGQGTSGRIARILATLSPAIRARMLRKLIAY